MRRCCPRTRTAISQSEQDILTAIENYRSMSYHCRDGLEFLETRELEFLPPVAGLVAQDEAPVPRTSCPTTHAVERIGASFAAPFADTAEWFDIQPIGLALRRSTRGHTQVGFAIRDLIARSAPAGTDLRGHVEDCPLAGWIGAKYGDRGRVQAEARSSDGSFGPGSEPVARAEGRR